MQTKTGKIGTLLMSKNCEVPHSGVEARMKVRVRVKVKVEVEVEVDQTPSDTLLHFYSRFRFCRGDYRKCAG